MVTTISSRGFDQATSGASKAATRGPVYITDRGRPAHVPRSDADDERLLGTQHVLDRLAEPAGVERTELPLPTSDDQARPAGFG